MSEILSRYIRHKNGETLDEPYIHRNKENFNKYKNKSLGITDSMIRSNYKQQAKLLESNAIEQFNKKMKKSDMDKIVKFHEELYDKMGADQAFKEISKSLSDNLISFGASDVKFSQLSVGDRASSKKIEQLEKVMSDLDAFLEGVNALVEEFNKTDALFVDFVRSKTGKPPRVVKPNMLASLSNEGVSEASKHFNKILELQKELGNKEGRNISSIREMAKTLSTDINKAKGGIGEIVQSYGAEAMSDFLFDIKGMGIKVEMSGQERTYLKSGDSRKNTVTSQTASRYVDKLGNQRGGLTAKSDSVNTIIIKDASGKITEIGMMGVSSKSYDYKSGSQNKVSGGSPMANVFTFGEMIDTIFEYNYANMALHEPGTISDETNIMNRFIASKAATFALSGAFGLKTFSGGSVTPAHFIIYTNKVIYFPEYLRESASKNSGKGLIFKPTVPNGIKDEGKRMKKSTNPTLDSFIRSRETLRRIRRVVKFDAYIS